MDLRQAFFFKGGDAGCLVMHGFTSAPAEVYELGLGRHLHQAAGLTVLGAKLKGHGTNAEDFARATEDDWIDSAVEAYERLRKRCKTVYVAGHSMGGLLALHIAEHYPVDKLILLAPAVAYRQRITYLAGIASHFMKNYSWPAEEQPEEVTRYMLHYKTFPTKSVHKMTRLQRRVRKSLRQVKSPVLLVMARKDTLVHVRTAKVLMQAMTVPVKTVWLEQSGHSVTVDCEKESVFNACTQFLTE